jgi:methoxymalonate biosynthesis acyl carrier protein
MSIPTGREAAQATAAESVRANLLAFLERQTKTPVAADADLFASGLVSSLFALQLVVQLESAFAITVQGPDLTLDNFRTVDAMTALVSRLRRDGADGAGR